MGPIVDPQAMSDLTQNSCVGMPRLCASSLRTHACTLSLPAATAKAAWKTAPLDTLWYDGVESRSKSNSLCGVTCIVNGRCIWKVQPDTAVIAQGWSTMCLWNSGLWSGSCLST